MGIQKTARSKKAPKKPSSVKKAWGPPLPKSSKPKKVAKEKFVVVHGESGSDMFLHADVVEGATMEEAIQAFAATHPYADGEGLRVLRLADAAKASFKRLPAEVVVGS